MNWKDARIAVLDTETTGLDPKFSHVWELGIVTVEGGRIVHEGCERFNPGISALHPKITEITGITIEDLKTYQPFKLRAAAFYEHLESHAYYASYNVPFDRPFVEKMFRGVGLELPDREWIDILVWVRQFQKYEKGKKLEQAAARLGIKLDNAHNALADATATAQIMLAYMDRMPDGNDDVLAAQASWDDEQRRSYDAWKKRQGGASARS